MTYSLTSFSLSVVAAPLFVRNNTFLYIDGAFRPAAPTLHPSHDDHTKRSDPMMMQEVASALKQDRLIKIFIGNPESSEDHYTIHQSVLEKASPYFVKALKHEDSLGAQDSGTLFFPEDDQDVWAVLAHWFVHHELLKLPQTREGTSLRIMCWATGDKYSITRFQDLIMLELLLDLERSWPLITHVKVAFESTPPGSILRTLMAEEVGFLVNHLEDVSESTFKYEHLGECDGIVGFASDIARAIGKVLNEKDQDTRRIVRGHPEEGRWRDFMVGVVLEPHWLFDPADKISKEIALVGDDVMPEGAEARM